MNWLIMLAFLSWAVIVVANEVQKHAPPGQGLEYISWPALIAVLVMAVASVVLFVCCVGVLVIQLWGRVSP